ncbi:DRTGG domain-containing protein [Ruminiclostridium sufflavum DSM 19573]|uniref:DRTGG domain-containing protein n=1 Tax=Ruminiclostridium sufflavum DSM 19573 TaxID=1121337 RepID=A0A318XRN3_9FIRM|nr:DRTGG domain-containing protein [Ruminiclostridium sufflavum]PYG88796.1 DRTGG domain-containing protein [Ruminiclostridium sufflavum DSM 19573]
MKIAELLAGIGGRLLTQSAADTLIIENVYICDLLSWVMSHAQKGDAWITVLTNVNVPAVAMLTDVACVIIPEGIEVGELTIKKAKENNITIISSPYSAFEICRAIIKNEA